VAFRKAVEANVDEREGASQAEARDIRARHRPERARQELSREDRLRQELDACRRQCNFCEAALRAISDAVVTVDLDGRITLLNPVAAHLTGWPEAQSIGKQLGDVVRFTDESGAAVDVLGAQSTWSVALLRRRDNHVVLVDGSVATIVDGRRQPLGYVITFRNVTAAKRMTDELTHQALHDPLTGLPNRRAFAARLKRAVEAAGQHGSAHTVLYFDLDGFKQVNDEAGHAAGDELLRQLALELRRQLREQDALARLGGDEFGVLLEDSAPEQARHVAEKIRDAVAAFRFDWLGTSFHIGASIGQMDFHDDGMQADELLRHADAMCYRAKALGRNRVVSWREEGGPALRSGLGGQRLRARETRRH
jgi:diguanylate cyclase (GGDEF)-like protein/PAS domain S-box-containing protein